MKKNNSSGFVLAETLVVTVFLMIIFGLIYRNFVPLIGEYEKRENYDSVDGKYSAYLIKRMIEDSSYDIPSTKTQNFTDKGFVRFECSDISSDNEKRNYCIKIVKNLEVNGCDDNGNNCEIYITRYRLKNSSDTSKVWFKNTVKAEKDLFHSGFRDYIESLPDYSAESLNYANYRVIICFKNTKGNNNYYSYATIEVSR